MSARQVFGAGILGSVAVAVPLVIVGAIVSQEVQAPRPDHTQWSGVDYQGDPTAEAALVELEERHLADFRSTVSVALQEGGGPYHLVTTETKAFVLVPREQPYTLDELASIAPETVTAQADGSFLVNESLVVLSGATLSVASDHGLTVLLNSTASSFVSITTLGGSITVQGTEQAPVRVSSWDPALAAVDQSTADGRAYIRVLGGHAEFAFAEFQSLGFWSGPTGGVALTGDAVPGSKELSSSVSPVSMTETGGQAAAEPGPGPGPTAPPPTQTPQPSETPPASGGQGTTPSGKAGTGTEEGKTDAVWTLTIEPDYSAHSRASANIRSTLFSENAFGLFVEGADNVIIADSTIRNSLVDGLLFFRDVTESSVTGTTSQDNAADGFSLAKSTRGTVLDSVTATGNGRNGISIEGGPLVLGPNPTGASAEQYGDNSVVKSTVTNNDRYGIEVVGGTGITVDGNTVSGSAAGIVVADGARTVTITDNTVRNTEKQGIVLRESASDQVVEGNSISGAEIGIYARNAGGKFHDNTIEKATSHAIVLVGSTGFSSVSANAVSGTGPSAVDVVRTRNASVSGNDTTGWEGTKPVDVTLRSIFQPLTVLWIVLGTLVFITAFLGIGRRKRQRQLQERRAPLSSYTRGIVTPEQARLLAAPPPPVQPRATMP